jgi:8-oxo-dGTP pyrophosphatase MutT (NUDIX family)
MIQRKDSLGFMDIMRGKYKLNEPEYIKKQLRGMTASERERLLNDDFEKIWHDLWGSDTESSHRYAHDRIVSKQKLTELKAGIETAKGDTYTLADLLRQEPVVYTTPEWGFPKGRRDPYESDINCAFRELFEETGISEDSLWKAVNVAPVIEQFYGSNDVHYRHSYYIAQYIGNTVVHFDSDNSEMTKEIGNLAWKNLDEALLMLRPENIEKKGILVQLAGLLRNFTPVLRDSLVGENTGEEQQERYVFTSRTARSSASTSANTKNRSGGAGRVDQSKRFFGARQVDRRVSDIRGPYQGQDNEGHRSYNKAAAGGGGPAIS